MGRLGSSASLKYLVIIETGSTSFGAYLPDLPGCVATGSTEEEAEAQIREAIAFHLDGLRQDGEPIPEPSSKVDYVELS